MAEETSKIKKKCEKTFTTYPFSEETITLRETLMNCVCKDRNERWHELVENTDMTKNGDYYQEVKWRPGGTYERHKYVTANQVATQLSLNSKPGIQTNREKLIRN